MIKLNLNLLYFTFKKWKMALNNHSEYGALLLRQPGNLRESDDEDDLITDTSSNGVRNVQDMLRVSRA